VTIVPNTAADHMPPPSLWTLAAPPGLWMAHVLACYVTVALWCGRWGAAAAAVSAQTLVGLYTAAALAGIAAFGAMAVRARQNGAAFGLDDDTPESRQHFLAWATVLLAGLSAVGVLFVAVATLLVPSCR
jgi:hypothetical protein